MIFQQIYPSDCCDRNCGRVNAQTQMLRMRPVCPTTCDSCYRYCCSWARKWPRKSVEWNAQKLLLSAKSCLSASWLLLLLLLLLFVLALSTEHHSDWVFWALDRASSAPVAIAVGRHLSKSHDASSLRIGRSCSGCGIGSGSGSLASWPSGASAQRLRDYLVEFLTSPSS